MTQPDDGGGRASELSETIDLLKRYVVQETLTPMKAIGRMLAYGLSGAFLLGIGLVVLDIAALRALQDETGRTFAGHWSWAPYLLAIVVAVLLLGFAYAVTAVRTDKKK
jgi:hypothetical protein